MQWRATIEIDQKIIEAMKTKIYERILEKNIQKIFEAMKTKM